MRTPPVDDMMRRDETQHSNLTIIRIKTFHCCSQPIVINYKFVFRVVQSPDIISVLEFRKYQDVINSRTIDCTSVCVLFRGSHTLHNNVDFYYKDT
jgi:hypothetical protein